MAVEVLAELRFGALPAIQVAVCERERVLKAMVRFEHFGLGSGH
jgi:hypothetical protein